MMPQNQRILFALVFASVGLAGTLLLLNGSPQPARAAGTLCVAPGGSGCGLCGGLCYTSVQAAVDAAAPGDQIRVAGGTYTGVQARGGMTQVVYISKTVSLRGGYDGNLIARDPDAYPTTLDAQGQGRVVSIVGAGAAPTLDGFMEISGWKPRRLRRGGKPARRRRAWQSSELRG